MALRFPGNVFSHGEYNESFASGSPFNDSLLPLTLDQLHDTWMSGEVATIFLSPARYSQVRKVAFWAVLRHEHTGSQPADEVRLRVMPRKASEGDAFMDSLTLPPSGSVKTKGGGESISVAQSAGRFLPKSTAGKFNQIVLEKIGATGTNGYSGVIWVEFDRFSGDDADIEFFQLWDEAAQLTEDEYVSWWLGVQNVTQGWTISGTSNSNYRPQFTGVGVAVIQTGSTSNKCCTMWSGSYPTISFGALPVNYFGSPISSGFLPYRQADWDGITSLTALIRQIESASGGGDVKYRLEEIDETSTTGTAVVGTEERINIDSGTASANYLMRTKDLFPFISGKGDANYALNFEKDGGGSPEYVSYWWEVTQENATKKWTPFQAGVGHQIDATDLLGTGTEKGRDAGLFDPLWFEDLSDNEILSREVWGDLLHLSAGNTPVIRLQINANLDENPATSAFNEDVLPQVDDAPNGTLSYKLLKSAITQNDPLTFAGKRALFCFFSQGDWSTAPADRPGRIGLGYRLALPENEFVDRGPLFQLDTFDPDGCASTAAGLGDNPGVLAIANGSCPIKKFNPIDETVTNLGIMPPFRGEKPAVFTADWVVSPDGGLGLGTYQYRYTFRNSCTGKESDPNPEDIAAITALQSPAATVTLNFTGVTIPSDEQVDEICIYRTLLDGAFPIMAKVGCFKIDETSTFTDTLSDEALDFTNDPLSLLNGFPPCAPIVAEFRNYLFAMGDIPILSPEGTVSAVSGSDEMTFSTDANCNHCMVGRFIRLEGDCKAYEIAEVLTSETDSPQNPRIKLAQDYEGGSVTGANFIIFGRPNRVYHSEPLEPDYWPAASFIDLEPGDGDRIIGAVSNFNGLVICKRRKTYVLRFSQTPATEVFVPARVSSDIGCIAPRSFAQVATGSVWLADRGVAIFDGRSVSHVPASDKVNDIFVNPENPNYVRRDRNGVVKGAVGVFYPKREQYLLLLPTAQTTRGANLMLVWDTSLDNITFYEFEQEFTAMEVAKDSDGNERVYLGDANGFVWIFDAGDTDGVGYPNATGTVRGTISSSGKESGVSYIQDDNATFLAGGVPSLAGLSGIDGLSGFDETAGMGLAGVCLHFRPAGSSLDDPWQTRFIFASTPTRLYLSTQLTEDLAGYEYMIGAIDFRAEFKPSNYGTDDLQKRDWQQIVTHEPESVASKLRVELLPDFQNSDPEEDTVLDASGDAGSGRVFDMSFAYGRQIRPVGRLIHNFQAVRFRNFAPDEPIRILQHTLRVTPKASR